LPSSYLKFFVYPNHSLGTIGADTVCTYEYLTLPPDVKRSTETAPPVGSMR